MKKSNRIVKKLLALGIVLSLTVGVQAEKGQEYERAVTAARTTAWKAITEGKGSGFAVAVMDRGKLVFSEGMGVRDRALNLPVESRTRFNIGSTSKMFTTVAVLLLVDEGKLLLDAPVVSYLPEFKMRDPRHRDITVRMLFNHSSGLPGTSFAMGYAQTGNAHQLLLDTLAHENLKHAPGELSTYCNDGFTLAELLVEKMSGQTFPAFLQKRILDPLGMHDTGLSVGELDAGTDLANFYDAKSAKKLPVEVAEVHGAGGLSSTVEDLCRFGNSFTPYGKQLLSDSSMKELRTPQPAKFAQSLRHRSVFSSFGWDYSNLTPFDSSGLQILAKGGNTPGYSTNLQVLPDQGLVIAMNISGNASGESLTRPILLGLLEDRGLTKPAADAAVRPPLAQPVPTDLDRFQGVYIGEAAASPVMLAVSPDRKSVTLTALPAKAAKPGPALVTYSYNDGLLIEPSGKSAYLVTVDDRAYLVATPSRAIDAPSIYAADWLSLQRVDKLEKPGEMPDLMAGERWFLRNAPTFVAAPWVDFFLTPVAYEGLPGYLEFQGIKKVESPTYASIAATHFRDQSELELQRRGAETWASVANFLFSSTPPTRIGPGRNQAVIASQGYNEWLELPDGGLVTLDIPKGARAIVLTPAKAVVFDSIVDSGQLYAPAGALVFCAGPAGSRFVVSVE